MKRNVKKGEDQKVWNPVFKSAVHLVDEGDHNKGVTSYSYTIELLVAWMEQGYTIKFLTALGAIDV